MNIEDLGFSKEEIEIKVVDQICRQVLSRIGYDEDGEYSDNTPYMASLNKAVKEKIDFAISKISDEHMLPNIEASINSVVLQKTNSWGEAKGDPVSFKEYLIEKSEKYMLEKVDYRGESRDKKTYGSFKAEGTRLCHMIDKHLKHNIEQAIKKMLEDANSQIANGIMETVKIQLQNILSKITVTTKTTR